MKPELYFELTVESYNGGAKNIRTRINSRDELTKYMPLVNHVLFNEKGPWNYNNSTELIATGPQEWTEVSKAVMKYRNKFGKRTVEEFEKKFLKGNIVDGISGARFIVMTSEELTKENTKNYETVA